MSDGQRSLRAHMKAILIERKRLLDALEVGNHVRAKFNGEVWEATIVQIQPYKHSLPEFRLRFGAAKTLYWTSGNQIVLPGDSE